MEQFACGYCGTNLMAQRRGGTVSLKAVTDAIKHIQVGTDKTAAELAIARLKEDLRALTLARKRLLDIHENAKGTAGGGVLLFLLGLVGGWFHWGIAVCILFVVLGLLIFIGGVCSDNKKQDRDKNLSEIKRTIRRIEENKQIVDS